MNNLKNILKETIKNRLNESRLKIPKIKLNGTFYHGSFVGENDDLFDELRVDYSDYGAIWVADEETVAEEFSEWHSSDKKDIRFVFSIKIKTNKIAEISYNLYQDLLYEWGFSDLRDSIPILKKMGYNGWSTSGSLGYTSYNDIAIFNADLINIESVKLLLNNNWTDYMSISDAQDLIDKHRGEGEL